MLRRFKNFKFSQNFMTRLYLPIDHLSDRLIRDLFFSILIRFVGYIILLLNCARFHKFHRKRGAYNKVILLNRLLQFS